MTFLCTGKPNDTISYTKGWEQIAENHDSVNRKRSVKVQPRWTPRSAASSPGLCCWHNLGKTNQVSWSNQINTQENWRISRRFQTTRFGESNQAPHGISRRERAIDEA